MHREISVHLYIDTRIKIYNYAYMCRYVHTPPSRLEVDPAHRRNTHRRNTPQHASVTAPLAPVPAPAQVIIYTYKNIRYYMYII